MKSHPSPLKREKSSKGFTFGVKPEADKIKKVTSENTTRSPPTGTGTGDFVSTVEKGKQIKDRIRQVYNEKFSSERVEREAEYAREIMQYASLASKSGDLYSSIDNFSKTTKLDTFLKSEDSSVPKNEVVGAFPISDQRHFPSRRPGSSWQAGLKLYGDIYSTFDKYDVEEKEETPEPVAIEIEDDLDSLRNKKRSIHEFSLTELKKQQYVSRSLPELSPYVSSRYFGEDAIDSYHATYRQLTKQGNYLLGGYSELHSIIKEEKRIESNEDVSITSESKSNSGNISHSTPTRSIFTLSTSLLREQGVLTPRRNEKDASRDNKKKDGEDILRIDTSDTLESDVSPFPSLETKKDRDNDGFTLPMISPMSTPMRSMSATKKKNSVGGVVFQDEQLSLPRPSSGVMQSSNNDLKSPRKQRPQSATGKKDNDTKLLSPSNQSGKNNTSGLPPKSPKVKLGVNTTVASTPNSTAGAAGSSSSGTPKNKQFNLNLNLDMSVAPEGDTYSLSPHSIGSKTIETASLLAPLTITDSPNKLKGILKSPILSQSQKQLNELHEELQAKISNKDYDKTDDKESCELAYQPASPRAIFLSGCLAESLPPRAQMVIRKRLNSTLDLAHIGIGNHMAMVLAEAIATLPYLQAVNLADNHLEDDGLSALIRAIARHPSVEILDISQNVIDDLAAEALADFIGNEDCLLKCLRMSDSNIDDGECAAFVDVLMHNRHLKELDMSKNLIGKDENLNTVQPDFVTGSESLADLIKIGSCPIETLNLHWNMIRLEGAEVLCDAIRDNQYLMHLDLSYNALGRNAACVLGGALIDNKVLQTLKIGNNGIDAIGCFTLLVGLRENSSLREISLDGNPIGEQGARILMKLVACEGHRLKISSKNCDFNVRYSDYPFGDYNLTLSQAYDRAILIELLETVANDTNIEISVFEYSENMSVPNPAPATGSKPSSQPNSRPTSAKTPASAGSSRPTSAGGGATQLPGGQFYRVFKFEEKQQELNKDEIKELDDLQSFAHVQDLTMEQLIKLAKEQDLHYKDSFNLLGLKKIINTLNIHPMNRIVGEIQYSLDPLETGHFDINDFVEYMIRRITVAKQRIKNLHQRPRCGLQRVNNPTSITKHTRYIPPMIGRVRIRVMESYNVSDETQVQSYPLSNSQCNQIIRSAQTSNNPLQLMLYGIDCFRLHLEEAQALFQQIGVRSDDPILALAKILLRMQNSSDAMRMIRNYTCNDVFKARRLKQRLGKAYYPIIGIYSGFYSLDLSNEFDRICLRKLIEKSCRNMESRRKIGKWDTSQNGNWSCFRNEVHNRGKKQETAPAPGTAAAASAQVQESPTISPKFFFPIPRRGKVEFDFVNIERPNPAYCHPAHEDRILDILLLSRLLGEDQVDHAIIHLNDLNMAIRRTMIPDGNPYWKPDVARANAIAENLFNMYSNLSLRQSTMKKAMKREAAKTMAVTEKPKLEKRKSTEGKANLYGSASSAKKSMFSSSMAKQALILEAMQAGTSKAAAAMKVPTNKLKQAITTFRSLSQRGKYDQAIKHWGKRMYDVMGEPNAYDEYKAATLLEFFESELAPFWLYCKHVSLILELLSPVGLANKSNLGSYRVELLIFLYDRIVDLHNFEVVMMVLNSEEQAAIHARIGILNFFNPCKPEGGFNLDLIRWEERQVAKMLIHLSVVEPGDNWLNKGFIFDRGFNPIPGWDLNITWLSEDGLPKKGLLSFEMFAGDGIRSLGCCVDLKLRMTLCSLVCIDQRDYIGEISRSDMLHDDMYYTHTYHKKGQKEPILLHPKDQVSAKIIPPLAAIHDDTTHPHPHQDHTEGGGSSTGHTTARSRPVTGRTTERSGNNSAMNTGRRGSTVRSTSAKPTHRETAITVVPSSEHKDENGHGNGNDDEDSLVSFAQENSIIVSANEFDAIAVDDEQDLPFGAHKVIQHFNLLPSYQERLRHQVDVLGQLWEKVHPDVSTITHNRASSPTVPTIKEQRSMDEEDDFPPEADHLAQSLASEYRIYTYEDANRHLMDEADVSWTYTTNFKIDSWI